MGAQRPTAAEREHASEKITNDRENLSADEIHLRAYNRPSVEKATSERRLRTLNSERLRLSACCHRELETAVGSSSRSHDYDVSSYGARGHGCGHGRIVNHGEVGCAYPTPKDALGGLREAGSRNRHERADRTAARSEALNNRRDPETHVTLERPAGRRHLHRACGRSGRYGSRDLGT